MNRAEWMKGICLLWSRGRHFSPSLPGDRYLNLSSPKKRPPGRNLGEHRSVRRSGTTSRGTALLAFCLRMRRSLKLKSLPYSWQKYSQRVNKYNFGRKKITKEAFRALAIPQSTPTNGLGVFAYRVLKWYNFINTSTPAIMRTWLDRSTVYRWNMVLEGIISAVLDSAFLVKSLMDNEYELKLRLKRLLSLIITHQMFL